MDPGRSIERTSPQLWGDLGAASTAHPLATGAAQALLALGGNAIDAAVAAQAVLGVVAPQSCGVGGDLLALVHEPDGRVSSFHGAGVRSVSAGSAPIRDDASAVTVPGIAHAWGVLVDRFGRRSLREDLMPALRLAERGIRPDDDLVEALREERERLERGGAGAWSLLRSSGERGPVPQPELARTLRAIGDEGPDAFYRGPLADAVVRAVRRDGGALTLEDLSSHATLEGEPLELAWRDRRLSLATPPSQAVLLGIALKALERFGPSPADRADHLRVEAIVGAFGFRDRAAEGAVLLDEAFGLSLERATAGSAARPFLHTAGVSVADGDGLVVSSLVSVFENFGAGTFVPEGGFTLNNRAACFTAAPNHPEPGKQPVHTLSPILVRSGGEVRALATPGADGQVQTLLQVLSAQADSGDGWEKAMAAPRWRSDSGKLLIERSHPGRETLKGLGHEVVILEDGDPMFGSVTSAGFAAGRPYALSDWRRSTWTGVL